MPSDIPPPQAGVEARRFEATPEYADAQTEHAQASPLTSEGGATDAP